MGVPFSAYGAEIYLRGLADERPALPTDPSRWRTPARARARRRARSATSRAAPARGATMRANRAAFDRSGWCRGCCATPPTRDWSTTVLGTAMPAPLLLAPIGVLSIMHPDGELAVARAAAELGVPMVLSTAASHTIEEVAAAVRRRGPRWYQLYWPTEDAVTRQPARPGRAPPATPRSSSPSTRGRWAGARTTSTRPTCRSCAASARAIPFSDPAFRAGLAAAARGRPDGRRRAAGCRCSPAPRCAGTGWTCCASTGTARSCSRASSTRTTPLRALDAGMDGIVVSNHGGRQVDRAVGSLDDAARDRRRGRPGGRRCCSTPGSAPARTPPSRWRCGADAVLLGRPYVYGLALGGAGRGAARAALGAGRAGHHPGARRVRRTSPSCATRGRAHRRRLTPPPSEWGSDHGVPQRDAGIRPSGPPGRTGGRGGTAWTGSPRSSPGWWRAAQAVAADVCPGGWPWAVTVLGIVVGLLPDRRRGDGGAAAQADRLPVRGRRVRCCRRRRAASRPASCRWPRSSPPGGCSGVAAPGREVDGLTAAAGGRPRHRGVLRPAVDLPRRLQRRRRVRPAPTRCGSAWRSCCWSGSRWSRRCSWRRRPGWRCAAGRAGPRSSSGLRCWRWPCSPRAPRPGRRATCGIGVAIGAFLGHRRRADGRRPVAGGRAPLAGRARPGTPAAAADGVVRPPVAARRPPRPGRARPARPWPTGWRGGSRPGSPSRRVVPAPRTAVVARATAPPGRPLPPHARRARTAVRAGVRAGSG